MNALLFPLILMFILAGLFVLIPILRFRSSGKTVDLEIRENKNVEVFKQSAKDLEEELANELISNEEFEKLKVELQRAFMSDMDSIASLKNKRESTDSNKALPLILLAVLFVGSFFFYQKVGSGQDLLIPVLLDQIQTAETEEQQARFIGELAVALDSRFQRHADNIQMGYTLGGVYLNLEQFSDAARIFQRLLNEMEDSVDKASVFGQLAQSQYLMADSEITSQVRTTIDQAIALNPNEQAVMSLLAIDAFVNLNFVEAIAYWRRQLIQLPAGSTEARVLQERIARVEELIPEEERAVTSGASVTVTVSVDDSIREQIPNDMRLFIFARGEDVPLPLAAQTFSLEELPLTITLDDSMSMTPQFTLSSAEKVYVGARISRTATAQPGDFEAISEVFVVADQSDTITLVIRNVVP